MGLTRTATIMLKNTAAPPRSVGARRRLMFVVALVCAARPDVGTAAALKLPTFVGSNMAGAVQA